MLYGNKPNTWPNPSLQGRLAQLCCLTHHITNFLLKKRQKAILIQPKISSIVLEVNLLPEF